MKAKTLFIALDGMTPFLIEKWTADGTLPHLARLLQQCRGRRIRCAKGFGNDAFWTSLSTGCLPDETGYFFRIKWDPENYRFQYREPGTQVKQDLFWTGLADTAADLAIIDIPEVKHGGAINGLEISEWLPHARSSQFQTSPTELQNEIIERFGDDPLNGSTERSTPRSDEETERDIDLLLQSIEKKTRAAVYYLERGGWDFYAVGYQQGHDAGHQFWHLHDPAHPRYSQRRHERHGDPLLKIYQHIDAGIGELADLAGEDINLVLVAGLSMQSKVSCNAILDRMLWEIDVYDRRLAGEDYPKQGELDKRRFVALQHNYLSGPVRINLAGRESRGVVAEGQEYDDTLVLLIDRLSQVVNASDGSPVVSEFIPIQKVYSGSRVNELADLFVVWNRESPIYEVASPFFKPIKIHVRGILDTRSGDHTGDATLYSNVDSMIAEEGEINVEDISAQLIELIRTGQRI